MIRQRVRLHYRKEGDLRLISHHDLLRVFERLFRRAGLPLGMSEGFHPKPRMSFPTALALGIAGGDEVMEFELTETIAAERLAEGLAAQTPPGLSIQDVRLLEPGTPKPRVVAAWYEISVPAAQQPALHERLAARNEQSLCCASHTEPEASADGSARSGPVELTDGILRFRLPLAGPGCTKPRACLAALGLAELEHSGRWLTRSKLELAPVTAPQASPGTNGKKYAHEEGNVD